MKTLTPNRIIALCCSGLIFGTTACSGADANGEATANSTAYATGSPIVSGVGGKCLDD